MTTLRIISHNLKDYGKSAVEIRERQHELLNAERPHILCLQAICDDLTELHRHVATLGQRYRRR